MQATTAGALSAAAAAAVAAAAAQHDARQEACVLLGSLAEVNDAGAADQTGT